jgi:hypothetical protein
MGAGEFLKVQFYCPFDPQIDDDNVVHLSSVREDTMGWFDRLFGTAAPATRLFARFGRKSRAPTDPDLLKIAKDRKGHISRKAMRDEYNRLLLEKYAHDKS